MGPGIDSRHTFSFGGDHDANQMGFRALQVINDDHLEPGAGFDDHGHRDVEILSFVLDGTLEHEDNLGTSSVIRPGEIQLLRAGTGVTHREFNHSSSEPVRFLQVWIVPRARGLSPACGQRAFDRRAAARYFALLLSRDGREQSLQVRQDVEVWTALIAPGETRVMPLFVGRHAWIHVARGSVAVNGSHLSPGDGASVSDEEALTLVGRDQAEILLFDLA